VIYKFKWYILSIIILILLEVSLVGGIGYWREFFWNAVQKRDLHQFIVLLLYFIIMALGACIVSGYTTYLNSYLALLIRTDLTSMTLNKARTYITVKIKAEGFEQRIQEDCYMYPFYMISLLIGILRNSLVLAVFVGIIWYQVGIHYVLLPTYYVLMGTFIAYGLAKPLIYLNYMNQCLEANFRQLIAKIKGLTLSMAEQIKANDDYKEVFNNNHNLFKTTKKLTYFQSFYNQVTVIMPYLLLYSVYFSGKIGFGIFMQVASSMNHIIDSMSYLINSFNDINNFLACRRRLKEVNVI
jgi:putative ATP-binding cassette transporter